MMVRILIYLGVVVVAIFLTWKGIMLMVRLHRRSDDDDGGAEQPSADVTAPLKPRPRARFSSAVADRPEDDA